MVAVAAEDSEARALDLGDEVAREGRWRRFLLENSTWTLRLLSCVEVIKRARRSLENRVELVVTGHALAKLPFAVGGEGGQSA